MTSSLCCYCYTKVNQTDFFQVVTNLYKCRNQSVIFLNVIYIKFLLHNNNEKDKT